MKNQRTSQAPPARASHSRASEIDSAPSGASVSGSTNTETVSPTENGPASSSFSSSDDSSSDDNDESLDNDKPSYVAAWAVEGAAPFRFFRIRQHGQNTSGNNHLMCGGIELYGVLMEEN